MAKKLNIIITVFSLFFSLFLTACKSSPSDEQIKKSAEKAVRDNMKDPYSAIVENLDIPYRSNRGSYLVCGTINAKNGYGAYVGRKYFVVVVKEIGSNNLYAQDTGIYLDSFPDICTEEGAIDILDKIKNTSSNSSVVSPTNASVSTSAHTNSGAAAVAAAAAGNAAAKAARSAIAAVKDARSAAESIPNTPSKDYYDHTNEFEGEYHTSKHSIRITKRNGTYLYQAWKQPKTMYEGSPDLILTNGQDSANGITFKKGNLVIAINKSNTADKELYIYINNIYRDHYYMYKN